MMKGTGTHFDFSPTPLRFYPRISAEMGVNLWIKHDDLFPLPGGGNKARKLQYIMFEGESHGCDALVTTGAAQSNHVRAAALMAANLGWSAKIFIHDEEPAIRTGNLLLATLTGASITFCSRKALPGLMSAAMLELEKRGKNPLYIWGGGHTVQGSRAYYDAAQELSIQADERGFIPDVIVLGSGTGATQAGLHVGLTKVLADARLIGVSVARDSSRGLSEVRKSVKQLASSLGIDGYPERIVFIDDFRCGGYEGVSNELIREIEWAAGSEGVILDPVYTGKAFLGLRSMVTRGFVEKGANVVFWHTGGLLNLTTSEIRHRLS